MDNPRSFLNKLIQVVIDRPKGSTHPKFSNMVYPINYGFVPDTLSGDGKELDAYILMVEVPLSEFEGDCIAYITREDDNDPKLIVVPAGLSVSDKEIIEAVNFQEKYFNFKLHRN